MTYALIENGVVVNLIWLNPMNADDFPNAVLVDGIGVGIGDTYSDGVFYRDGAKLVQGAAAAIQDMQTALETVGVTVDG
jgi:hypothetical protein